MERVVMRRSVLASIHEHAFRDAPRECCGLLVGREHEIDEAVATRNMSDRETTRYIVDPAAHFALIRRLRGTERTIVGAYHSHPRGAAEPSEVDVAEAIDRSFLYVIVALLGGMPMTRGFRVVSDTVTPVALVFE